MPQPNVDKPQTWDERKYTLNTVAGKTYDDYIQIGMGWVDSPDKVNKANEILIETRGWTNSDVNNYWNEVKAVKNYRPEDHPKGSLAVEFLPNFEENLAKLNKNVSDLQTKINLKETSGQHLQVDTGGPGSYVTLKNLLSEAEDKRDEYKSNSIKKLIPLVVGEERLSNISYNSPEGKKRTQMYRAAVQRLIQADNPDKKISYTNRGLIVDGIRVKPSIFDSMFGSALDAFGIGAEVAIGTALLKQGAKMAGKGGVKAFAAGALGPFGAGLAAAEIAGVGIEMYQRRQIANEFNLLRRRDYDSFMFADDVLAPATDVAATYAAGMGVIGAGKGVASVISKKSGDEIISTIENTTLLDRQTLYKQAVNFVEETQSKGMDTEIVLPQRKFFGPVYLDARRNTEAEALQAGRDINLGKNPKTFKDLSENDLILRYILEADPAGDNITKSIYKQFPTMRIGMLRKAADFRAKEIKNQLKGSLKSGEEYNEVMNQIQGYMNLMRNAADDFESRPTKVFIWDTSGKPNVLDDMYGRKDLNLYNTVKNTPDVRNDTPAGKALMASLEKIMDNDPNGNIPINKLALELMGLQGRLSKPTMNQLDTALALIDEKPLKDLLDISNKLGSIAKLNTLKVLNSPETTMEQAVNAIRRLNESAGGLQHYNDLLKNIGEGNKNKIELAIINSSRQKFTSNINRGSNVDELSSSDWIEFSNDLKTFTPTKGSHASNVKGVIDFYAKRFRNDPNISKPQEQLGSLNPTTGTSIATTVKGKIDVVFANGFYQAMMSYNKFSENIYRISRLIKESVFAQVGDDPTKQKSFNEVVKLLKQIDEEQAKGAIND